MRYSLILALACFWLSPVAAQAQVYGDPNSLVDYWYRTYLGRAPDPGGLANWANELNQGVPPDQVLATILGSDEYYQRGGSTPQGFIGRLYSDVLGRAPTPVELNFWVQRMYVEDRIPLSQEILDQNPGVWVGSNAQTGAQVPGTQVLVPPTVVTPGVPYYRDWHRDGNRDWNHRNNVWDYRHPAVHEQRHDNHEHRH